MAFRRTVFRLALERNDVHPALKKVGNIKNNILFRTIIKLIFICQIAMEKEISC